MSQRDRPIARRPVDLILIRLEFSIDQVHSISNQADYSGLGHCAQDLEDVWLALASIASELGRAGGRYHRLGPFALSPAPPES